MLQRARLATALASSMHRAAVMPALLPQPAVAAVAASTTAVRTLFTRSGGALLMAPPPRKEKAARKGKKGAAVEEADDETEADLDAPAPTLDSAAAASSAASAPREDVARPSSPAAGRALPQKQASKKAAEAAALQAKKAAEVVVTRRDQRSVESVIEKEVPLMDLSGLTPGQNKFADVLQLLREQKYPSEVIEDLEQVGDLATGSTAEILSGRLANLRAKYGRMPHDTGSPEVQVAMLTERLKGYERHQAVHGSDIAARKNFLAVWQRRRKLLKYLRKTRYETYAFMMRELQLKETDIDNYGLDRKSATQAPRIKRD
jgi:small subunit ribosomal protein S15